MITCATSLDHYGLQDLLQEMRNLVTILDGVKSKVLVLIEYKGQTSEEMQGGEVLQKCCSQIQGAAEDLGNDS